MSDGQILLAKLFLATLIVPTITYVAVRQTHGGPRPRAAKVAAWLCLWVGQLAAPMAGVVVVAGWVAYSYWQNDWLVLALVYGAAMAGFAVFLFIQTLRVLHMGTLALGQATEEVIVIAARRLLPRGLVAIAVAGAYWYLLMYALPMPGRWDPLIYFALVVVPVSLASLLVTLIAVLMRRPPWL